MKILFYISIICVLFFGCKKEHRYEEDPKASHSTPQERLSGNWKIVDYTFNGVSIYNQMNTKAKGIYDLNKVIFTYIHYGKKDNDAIYGDSFDIYPFPDNQKHGVFNDYNYLKIYSTGCSDYTDSLYNYWFVSPETYCSEPFINWRVIKLYENDFQIVLNSNGGEYKMVLVKTKL